MVLDFEGIKNSRELGGIKAACGRSVKPNLLIRTAELSKASDNDVAILSSQFKLYAVIDFRDSSEYSSAPDRAVPNAVHYSFPAMPNTQEGGELNRCIELFKTDPIGAYALLYRMMVVSEYTMSMYRRFFDVLLEADGRAVLWHCTQGKDRTGIAAYLLLSALGADEKDILNEYFLTNDAMKPEYDEICKTLAPEQIKPMYAYTFVHKECFGEFIGAVNEKFGGVMNYLRDCIKLTDAEIEKLRTAYTE